MPRITIDLPERFTFATDIPLLILHINLGGHLDNAMLLTLGAESRVRYWEHLGYTAFDMEGVGSIVADAALEYRSEAHHGETMVIEQATRDYHKYGFDIVWRMSDRATGREVARGKTGILCFNTQTRKVALLPDKLRERLQAVPALRS
jgi:acyl-CoA thioester hydrolase